MTSRTGCDGVLQVRDLVSSRLSVVDLLSYKSNDFATDEVGQGTVTLIWHVLSDIVWHLLETEAQEGSD